ncbi:MAG: DUF1629 domain-containing protein [Pirellulales bacterium]
MHYIMSCEGEHPIAAIDESPRLPGGPWMHGRPIAIDVPKPLVYTLDAQRPGKLKAMYDKAVPLVRDDLLEALREAGVDNLEVFDAVVRDAAAGKEYTNYKAFNIVGVIACADMDQSEVLGGSTVIDVDFASLVLDESKCEGVLMFRLAEAVNAIVVDERVKGGVEASGVPGMVFYGPGEWCG